MSQKFLSPVKLSGISTGSILKVDSNGVIVAAVSGTDYIASSTSSQWTTTGNDIYYNTGNVGIGESSPDGILHIKGSSQVTEFYIESSTGTSTTSGAIKIGQNNRAASDLGGEMVFSVQSSNVGGTFWREAMTILHTGWVGIGTSSPSTNFDVNGSANIGGTLSVVADDGTTASAVKTLILGGGTATTGNGQYIQFRTSTVAALGSQISGSRTGAGAASDLRFSTTNSSSVVGERMRIDKDGNVGIGTTSPSYPLQVNGVVSSVASAATMLLNRTGGSTYGAGVQYQTSGTNNWIVGTGQTTVGTDYQIYNYSLSAGALAISYSSNNVGIGTTSPAEKLDVAGAIALNGYSAIYSPNSGDDIYGNIRVIRNLHRTDGMYIGYDNAGTTNGHLRFYANGTTERMRIDASNGNVGIGTTSPGAKLDVNGTAIIRDNMYTTGALGIELTWSGNDINDSRIGRIRPISTPSQNPYAGGLAFDYYKYDGSSYNFFEGMRLNGSGNVGIGTASPAYKLDIGNNTSETVRIGATATSGATGSLLFGSRIITSQAARIQGIYGGSWDGTLVFSTQDAGEADGNRMTEKVRITSSGNVGINITAPTEKLQVGGSAAISVTSSIDPDSYRDYVVIGNITDGSGWSAKGIGGNAGAGDSWAIAHNGASLFFGIGNGSADNSMATYMEVSPSRQITLPSLATAGFLKTNASGTLSVDTNTYSLSGHTHTAATTSAAGFMSASDKTKLDGITDAADAYGYWRVSDGTNTENIASQNTLTFAADGSASVTYDTGTNTLTIGAAIVEADTLNTVVARGSTTTSAITLGPASTSGGPMIYQTYSGDDKIGSIGSEYSSGAMLIGYGAAGKNGGSGYVSTFDNFPGHRGLIKLSAGEFSILNTGSAVQTTTGDALTMTTRFVVNNDGNVGIGTTSPSTKLDVEGNIRAKSGIYYIGTVGSNYLSTDGTSVYLRSNASTYFEGNGFQKGVWDSSGNLGIGTTSPSYKLQVKTSDNTSYGLAFENSAANTAFVGFSAQWDFDVNAGGTGGNWLNLKGGATGSSGGIRMHTLDTERLRITHDGKVGIGTTSPGSKLSIDSGNLEFLTTSPTTVKNRIIFSETSWGDSSFYIEHDGALAGASNYLNIFGDGSSTGVAGGITIKRDGNLIFTKYTAGLLKTDASGNVSLDTSTYATQGYVNTAIANLVDSAPDTLDTLNELAAALGDDAAFSTTVTTALGNRLRVDANQSLDANQQSVGRANLGLGDIATETSSSFVAASGDTMTGSLTINTGTDTETTAAYGTFDRLIFNNQYNDTSRGPNKIVLYDDTNWIGGLGIHSNTIAYYSGAIHKWYKSASTTSFSEKMALDGDGNLTLSGTVDGVDLAAFKTAYDSHSHSWGQVTSGYRTDYTLGFRAPTNSYAGFSFLGTDGNEAGYFLIRGTSDNDVYTAEGITLVADQGWLTLAQRARNDKGIRFMTGATSSTRMVIENGGNVGIGTTSPARKLSVVEAGNGNIALFTNTTDADLNINLSSGVTMLTPSTGILAFGTSSTERMRINASGNVGIGTTSPSAKVHSKGEIRVDYNDTDGSTYITGYGVEFERGTNYLRPRGTDGTQTLHLGSANDSLDWNNIQFKVSDYSKFRVAGSDIMWIDSTGVGIGTTSPSNRLSVSGTGRVFNAVSSNDQVVASFTCSTTSPGIATVGFEASGSTSDYHVRVGANATSFVAYTNNIERLRIDSSGNVGIGTTAPISKLHVSGSITAGGKISYTRNTSSLDTTGVAVAGLTTGGNGSSALFTFTMYGGQRHYQKVVYSCQNAAGTWYVAKVIDEGTNGLDVVASADSGSTITFTFRAASSTQYYSPAVHVECLGASINTSYL